MTVYVYLHRHSSLSPHMRHAHLLNKGPVCLCVHVNMCERVTQFPLAIFPGEKRTKQWKCLSDWSDPRITPLPKVPLTQLHTQISLATSSWLSDYRPIDFNNNGNFAQGSQLWNLNVFHEENNQVYW